ncbi:MAG: glycosyltransferase family 39 protein [Magnetococcales bacterium]|nr:glycosyltransferase family 39 protein [Magnetococcales bacterium]
MKDKLLTPLAGLLVAGIILLLFSKGLHDPDVGWPDADRVLMDGLFLYDFLRELPALLSADFVQNAYRYALEYYAQYPALSLMGSRPPFFPLIEALFFSWFGVRDFSGKLAVLAMALCGAVAWHDLIRRSFDRPTALLASCLLFSTPFIAQWGWYPMLEIPVLAMSLLTTNFFWRYSESGRPQWLFATAIGLALTIWTKQTALFMAIWFLGWLLITGQARIAFRQRATWWAMLLCLLLVLPLGIATLLLGKLNITLAFEGMDPALRGLGLTDWVYLRKYLDLLWQTQVTWPVLMLALVGVVLAGWRRDRRVLFYLLLIVTTYIFFTVIRSDRVDRYTIFWVPAFALLAALPGHYLRHNPLVRNATWLTLTLVILWQVQVSHAQTPTATRGYQEAARLAMQHTRHGMIFMDGVNNGYFIYYVRLNDPERRHHVIRGDKLLHSSAIFANAWTEVHVQDVAAIRNHFDRYGIDIIVVEEANYANLPIHQMLRDDLKGDDFELLQSIPVESGRSALRGQKLLVYRYKHAKPPTRQDLAISIPLIGKTFQVTIGRHQ